MADRFEDLDAWKVGRKLANLIYAFGREGALSKDYSFKDQIQKTSGWETGLAIILMMLIPRLVRI